MELEEKEVAKARTIYLPSSKIISNLERKLSILKPEIKAQLET